MIDMCCIISLTVRVLLAGDMLSKNKPCTLQLFVLGYTLRWYLEVCSGVLHFPGYTAWLSYSSCTCPYSSNDLNHFQWSSFVEISLVFSVQYYLLEREKSQRRVYF